DFNDLPSCIVHFIYKFLDKMSRKEYSKINTLCRMIYMCNIVQTIQIRNPNIHSFDNTTHIKYENRIHPCDNFDKSDSKLDNVFMCPSLREFVVGDMSVKDTIYLNKLMTYFE